MKCLKCGEDINIRKHDVCDCGSEYGEDGYIFFKSLNKWVKTE